jgi:hypothetical protein
MKIDNSTRGLLGTTAEFHCDADGLSLKHAQHIPSSFLSRLAESRGASRAPAGETHRVASIPVAVVEKWLTEGFDITQQDVTASQIVARLKAENLNAFIATTKNV